MARFEDKRVGQQGCYKNRKEGFKRIAEVRRKKDGQKGEIESEQFVEFRSIKSEGIEQKGGKARPTTLTVSFCLSTIINLLLYMVRMGMDYF